MVKHPLQSRSILVEFEFSRLAQQYLIDAYAQVLPEIRATAKVPQENQSPCTQIQKTQV